MFQLEAKVHYDMTVRHKTAQSPPWWRRLLFLGALLGAGAWAWRRTDQQAFDRGVEHLGRGARVALNNMVEFFTSNNDVHSTAVTIS